MALVARITSLLAKIKQAGIRKLMRWCARRPASTVNTLNVAAVRRIMLWQFGGVGDMLLTTPVIRALEEAYPEAKIHVWCSDPEFAAFLSRFPNVASISPFRVYDYDARTLLRNDVRCSLRHLLEQMQEQSADMLVNLHVPALLDWWAVEWWLVRRLNIPFAMGFDPRFIREDSVFGVSINAMERDGIHYTELYRRLLNKAGIDCGTETLFPLTQQDEEKAQHLLADAGKKPRICMHIGARRLKVEGKMWPLERFVQLAEQIELSGMMPVVIGVESEAGLARDLCGRVDGCLNLVGKTSLGEMAAVIAACDGFVGHDSGPFHVAAAVGTPCVAICGRPDPEPEYLSYERKNVTALVADAPEEIAVDAVLEALHEVIADGEK